MKEFSLHLIFNKNEEFLVSEVSELLSIVDSLWNASYAFGSGLNQIETGRGYRNVSYENRLLDREKRSIQNSKKLRVSKLSLESPLEIIAIALAAPTSLLAFLHILSWIKIGNLEKEKLELEIERLKQELHPNDKARANRIDDHLATLSKTKGSVIFQLGSRLGKYSRFLVRLELDSRDEQNGS